MSHGNRRVPGQGGCLGSLRAGWVLALREAGGDFFNSLQERLTQFLKEEYRLEEKNTR